MTTESGSKPTSASIKEERLRDLLAIDARIVELVAERSRLMRKESAWRRSRGQSRIDPALEKGLWTEWEAAGRELGVAPRLLRQLFNTLNLFGDKSAQIKRREGEGYVLAPRAEPLKVRTPAPRSLSASRMWTLIAAAADRKTTLAPVILNDPLVELIKGLNQCGAALSWTDDAVENAPRAAGALDFEDKLVFVGDDSFNLYMLLALALSGAGRVKFAGGAALKLLDVSALNAVLPALGARLAPLNPHSKGLPARLECGGEMQRTVDLPASVPAQFAAALVLAGWSYPGGLNLRFPDNPEAARCAAEAASLLKACGVDARCDETGCTVPEARPDVPAAPEIGTDTALAAYLLAMPLFTGGSVTLLGAASESTEAGPLAALAGLGVDLTSDEDGLTATAVRIPDSDIDLGTSPELFPLSLALALRAKRELSVALPADSETVADARTFLDRLGADYTLTDNALTITPARLSWDSTWASPGPFFCLAAALVAFIRPGIALENPGQLTAVWPQFWNIYNTLPTGKMRSAPVKETPVDKPKRRRIKI